MNEFKEWLFENVYLLYPTVNPDIPKAQALVKALFRHYCEPGNLPEGFEGPQGAIDYIAGMTDRFAIETYAKSLCRRAGQGFEPGYELGPHFLACGFHFLLPVGGCCISDRGSRRPDVFAIDDVRSDDRFRQVGHVGETRADGCLVFGGRGSSSFKRNSLVTGTPCEKAFDNAPTMLLWWYWSARQ